MDYKFKNCAVSILTALGLFACCVGVTNPETDYVGIDVSHHQGKIDWKTVGEDERVQFVYVKATEGATYVDDAYATNVKETRKNGLKVGSYHYLRNTSTVSEQFKNFKTVVKKDEQDLIPMLDVEEKVAKADIQAFCDSVENYYGVQPVIYGTNMSYNELCAPEFNDHILMTGRYGTEPPFIKGKGHYSIWQYSQCGIIKGISKPVDLSRFHPDFSVDKLQLKK